MANEIPKIDGQVRDKLGSRYAARLRQDGRLPGVLYGHGQDPVHVSFDAHELDHVLHAHSQILEVKVDGKADACLIKDIQWDHLGREVVHVDLTRVDLSEKVTVEVEIELKGEPKDLEKPGAIMDTPTAMLEVECRADSIPEMLYLDVAEMQIGDSKAASEVPLPEGVELVTDPETVVAHISFVEEEEIEVPDTGTGDEEPEVIGRETDEDEEGAEDQDEDKE